MEAGQPPVVRATSGQALSRREFFAASAIGLLAWQKSRPVTIGVQTYSFRDRSLEDTILAMQKVGLQSCELWQDHVEPRKLSRSEMRKWRETVSLDHFHRVRDRFAKAKIALSAYNISITDRFSETEIERAFEMTKALGAPVITSSSNTATVARIAPLAAKHRMLVGMHNHSKVAPNEFASRQSLLAALPRGDYIAVNLDIGHFTAANEDAVAFLAQHHDRIVTLHIKDRKRDQGPYTPFGTGDAPIVAVLQLLQKNGWPIAANIEYEYEGADTVDEVGKCLVYCRKALNL